MNRQLFILTALLLLNPQTIKIQAKSDDNVGVPTISVIKLDISDKNLKLSYEIRNTTKQDIWILVGFGFPQSDTTFEVFMDVDN